MTLHFRPLGPDTLPDFLRFFDGEAFADNPRWSSCYCQCFLEDHNVVRWADRTAVENRAKACERVAEGTMQGLLAWRDGQVVGWCHAAPRSLFHALDDEAPLDAAADPQRVGTILCFLIAPAARGQGVATALLEAACDHLKAQGCTCVEANPRPAAQGAGDNHWGPLSMYLAQGFETVRTDDDASVWVRRALG